MKRLSPVTTLVCAGLIAGGLTARTVYARRHLQESAVDHFNESDRLEKEGRTAEAIQQMQLALADNPRYFEARLGLADMYQMEHHLPEAVNVLEEGIHVAPGDQVKYLTALSDTCAGTDDQRAIGYLRRSLTVAPDDQRNQRQLPLLLERAKEWPEAETAWKEYEKRYPQDSSGPRGLGRVHRHLQPPQDRAQSNHGVQYFTRVVQRVPGKLPLPNFGKTASGEKRSAK